MKLLFKIFLAVLMISFVTISNAQPPPSHPAMQMRKYYADIYTGQTIVSYESHDLDSVLMVVSRCVIAAQVISVYSYINSPYNERVFSQTLEEASSDPSSALAFSWSDAPCPSVLSSFPYYWTSRQYYRYLSGRVSGRYSNW